VQRGQRQRLRANGSLGEVKVVGATAGDANARDRSGSDEEEPGTVHDVLLARECRDPLRPIAVRASRTVHRRQVLRGQQGDARRYLIGHVTFIRRRASSCYGGTGTTLASLATGVLSTHDVNVSPSRP